MIYGANGYTGVLLAEEAVARGHTPVLAGRSREGVTALADRLGLQHAVFSLDDPGAIASAIEGCEIVLHAAGPFVRTAEPMRRACIAAGASYADITGEIPVFQATFDLDADARARGVCLMSGVGFDVIPTDCLAAHVARKVPGATRLEIAFSSIGSPSAGTTKSMLEHLPSGSFVRRAGKLTSVQTPPEIRRVRFDDKERTVMAIPWGDLETAYRSTGIGDITTYMAMPEARAKVMRALAPALGKALHNETFRSLASRLVERTVKGPTPTQRSTGRSHVWARAASDDGRSAEAWLETLEGYAFTAKGGVRSVERILEERPKGALTPSLAFGPDFVLGIEHTRRLDVLP
jgi:short subunit dehydrogenase-like uncharacterized protein